MALRKYLVEIIKTDKETNEIHDSYEVPIYGKSLDDVVEKVSRKYESQGVVTGRIRPSLTK